jgi:hypothetical protein
VGGAAEAERGFVSRRDIVKLKRIRDRQRILRAAFGVVAGVAAFVLGVITRDVVTGTMTYPYATVPAATVAGTGLGSSSKSEKRLVFVVIGVLCAIMFTLGVLLSEGHTESASPSMGVVPEYGVFHS